VAQKLKRVTSSWACSRP